MMVVSLMHTHINGHKLENKLYVNVNDLTFLLNGYRVAVMYSLDGQTLAHGIVVI